MLIYLSYLSLYLIDLSIVFIYLSNLSIYLIYLSIYLFLSISISVSISVSISLSISIYIYISLYIYIYIYIISIYSEASPCSHGPGAVLPLKPQLPSKLPDIAPDTDLDYDGLVVPCHDLCGSRLQTQLHCLSPLLFGVHELQLQIFRYSMI